MTKLSIVATMYQSQGYVKEFYTRAKSTLEKISVNSYEFVLVDDGSPDQSLQEAIALHRIDSNVKVVQLSRNFGHHKAMMTGLTHACGELTFLIDIDLEEKPEELERFWTEFHKEENKEVDVIYGVQDRRKGGWFERWSGAIFYRVFNALSERPIPQNLITSRLMSRAYKEALLRYKDRALYIFGLVMLVGFNQRPLICHKKNSSTSTYNLRHKISLAVNSVTSFSAKPLHYIFYLGFLISISSFIFIIYVVMNKVFFAAPISGWTSLIISIYMLGGMVLASLGALGIYIAKIFDEVKDRPYTIVRKLYEKKKD